MSVGNCAALTMLFHSYEFLQKWVAHYANAFGRENLFIFSHGNDPKHREIAEGCNVVGLPRQFDRNFNFDKSALFGLYSEALLRFYKVVIVSDVDEYIALHPASGHDLADYLVNQCRAEICSPLGLNIISEMDTEIDWSKPILARSRYLCLSDKYSKPVVLKKPARFGTGMHGVFGEEFELDKNLMLFHAKFADMALAKRYVDSFEEDRLKIVRRARGKILDEMSESRQRGWDEGALRQREEWLSVETIAEIEWFETMQNRLLSRGVTQDRHGAYCWRNLRRLGCKVETPLRIANLL